MQEKLPFKLKSLSFGGIMLIFHVKTPNDKKWHGTKKKQSWI